MAILGTISLQTLDHSDVFITEDIVASEDMPPWLPNVGEYGFDVNIPYITGHVPQMIPVQVDGDTTLILGWFKGTDFTSPFTIRMYIEYEEADLMVETSTDACHE